MHWSIARNLPESGIPHQPACKNTQSERLYHVLAQNTSYRTVLRPVAIHPLNRTIPPIPPHLFSYV